jgi:aminoglycoside 3-N-acetyltransferase
MALEKKDIMNSIKAIGLAGKTVCMHSSMRSFGEIKGGADSVIDAFLESGCTLITPTFSFDAYMAEPPADMKPERNGIDYGAFPWGKFGNGKIYSTDSVEIDANMGAIPAALVSRKGRVRGNHPLCSFSALGPFATEIISSQQPLDVFAPLRELALFEGHTLLAGVDLNKLTLLHLAEQMASRKMFRRCALSRGGVLECESGGCSDGFMAFDVYLKPMEKSLKCGESRWRAVHARKALVLAARIIQIKPEITRCAVNGCKYCADLIAGGPV